jgi:integrase
MASKYTVEKYLQILKSAKRSDKTTNGYRKVFLSYAKFMGVPVNEIHNHLTVDNLLRYAESQNKMSTSGVKGRLSVLHRYFHLNGVVFDELEYNATKPNVIPEQNDKPLELATLQKMMDLSDSHGRAIISFLVSTGCRAGETSQILLPDVNGDTVTIRNEIAKGGRGGKVYLTAEAREFLDIWLADRDKHIRLADARMEGLGALGRKRPVKDQRLFAISYSALHRIFARLFSKADGEQGKYHAACTIHSCRKYFRTHAAKTMHPDLVTNLMRQTGYLDNTYVRMSDAEKYEQFKKGEASLYLTRADHRIQTSKLSELEQENAALQARLLMIEQAQQGATGILKSVLTDDDLENIVNQMVDKRLKERGGK